MKKWIFATAVVFGFFGIFGASFAIDSASAATGVDVTLKESRSVIKEFRKAELNRKTQLALNAIVGTGVSKFRLEGYTELADRFEKEWKRQYASYFLNLSVLDVGDHAPLNQWLADFYKKLEMTFGDLVLKAMKLDDINTINYVLPVVFQPKGDQRNGDTWDKVEYQKHFVPFAAIVIYWACRGSCTGITFGAGAIGSVCGLASEIPRFVMKTWIAPPLSNWVYDLATKGKTDGKLVLSEEAMLYLAE
ncbi:MAG: hypothetical protein AB7P04_03200 [Bacteriovoracia bacterium]